MSDCRTDSRAALSPQIRHAQLLVLPQVGCTVGQHDAPGLHDVAAAGNGSTMSAFCSTMKIAVPLVGFTNPSAVLSVVDLADRRFTPIANVPILCQMLHT
ncbi:MAG: hypothetical protein KDE53_30280 [Caldilineaceae bacterium]|nr:hypothetical protein [Caldilineaceae bacterium]